MDARRSEFRFESDVFGGLELHKCQRCPFLCLSVDDMKCHSTAVHSKVAFAAAEALLSCPACPDRFFTADFFGSHLYYHHRVTPADARLLLASFVDTLRRKAPPEATEETVKGTTAKATNATEPPETRYSKTGRPNGARSHGTTHSGYECTVRDCGARLNLAESLAYHEKCHPDGDKELFCPECRRRFANLETLHNHLWKEHRIDVELHKCDRCPYRVYSLNRLNNVHRKIHSDEKNYRCDACSKAFKNSKQLANHRSRHRKSEGPSKKYPCDVCNLELSTPNHLEAHKRNVHDKIKLFNCERCQYSSYTKSSLLLHVRSHTGERPYRCSACDSKFSNKGTLRRHAMLHGDRKPYKCDRCSYECIQASTIKAHVKLKHPGLKTDLLHACSLCPYSSVSEKRYDAHLSTHGRRSVISVKSMVDLNGSPDETPKISVKSNLVLKGSDDLRRFDAYAPVADGDSDRSDVSSAFVDRSDPGFPPIDSGVSTEIRFFDGRSPRSAYDRRSDPSFVVSEEFSTPTFAESESGVYSDECSEAFLKRESEANYVQTNESNSHEFGLPVYETLGSDAGEFAPDVRRAEIVVPDASCDIKSSFFGDYT